MRSIITQLSLVDSARLPQSLVGLFSVLWMGQVNGNTLLDESGNDNNITITNKDFVSNYLPSTSTATFSLNNSSPLKVDDDWDGLGYTDAGAVRQFTVTELNNNDYVRWCVKYSDSSPYNVQWLGLLKSDTVLTTEQIDLLHKYFRLGLFWSGSYNTNGYYKENRPMEGLGYKGWIAEAQVESLAEPPLATKKSINKLALEIRNRGLDYEVDRFYLWMNNDAVSNAGASRVPLFGDRARKNLFPTSITHTVNGLEANGTNQRVDLDFIPSEDGIKYTLNSASFFTYQYKIRTKEGSILVGLPSGTSNFLLRASSTAVGNTRLNTSSNLTAGITYNSVGYVAIDRSAASGAGSVRVVRGSTVTSYDVLSTALPTVSINLFKSPTEWGDQGLSCAGFGRSFTNTEHGFWETAILNHKNRLGL